MIPEWTGEAFKQMHLHKISAKSLANAIGWNEKYLSVVLHGHRRPSDAEGKVMTALHELIEGRVKT